MGKTASTQEAPDSQQIISLLDARLRERGDALPDNIMNSAVPMLIDRFKPELRQRFLDFILDHRADLYVANDLLYEVDDPNIVSAVLHNYATIDLINSGREVFFERNEVAEVKSICHGLKLVGLSRELTNKDFNDIKALYLMNTVCERLAPWPMVTKVSEHLGKNLSFLQQAQCFIQPLTALMDSVPYWEEPEDVPVIELCEYMLQHRSEGPRIVEAIRTHKGFNEGLMDQLLASECTPLEEGVL